MHGVTLLRSYTVALGIFNGGKFREGHIYIILIY